jgi:hypothetical protein
VKAKNDTMDTKAIHFDDYNDSDLVSECIIENELNECIETPFGNFEFVNNDPLPDNSPFVGKRCFICHDEFSVGSRTYLIPVEPFYDSLARTFMSHRGCFRLYIVELIFRLRGLK